MSNKKCDGDDFGAVGIKELSIPLGKGHGRELKEDGELYHPFRVKKLHRTCLLQ